MAMGSIFVLAATLLTCGEGGVELKLESAATAVDPAHSVFVRLELSMPEGTDVATPDLRDRVVGFSLAEDFDEPPVTEKGRTVKVVNWRLVPEPCAEVYKIRPFVVGSFHAGPVYFENPPPRDPVTGAMEVAPKRDLPPLSWKLVGQVALGLAGLAALVALLVWGVRYLARRVKEHRMSPIERAWVELDRLLKKGLPGRGRYKDFYVELTMVVRRYVQRKYGIRAPHLTTEEFLAEIAKSSDVRGQAFAASDTLSRFLESADLVKFAGVEATPDMADGATESARTYLRDDCGCR